MSDLGAHLARIDPTFVGAQVDGDFHLTDTTTGLVGAVAAAARGAAARVCSGGAREDRKKRIDGGATRAAEAFMRAAGLSIEVVAGEGPRDASPGAFAGQTLGPDSGDERLHGIFDYVDGTSLAADGLPGALSLGGFGRRLRSLPDLQAFMVLAPRAIADDIDVMAVPEEAVPEQLARIAAHMGRQVRDLRVATHSITSNPSHLALIDAMRSAGAHVIVPDPVTVEPPYILSMAGLAEPRVDAMIGAIGLSELAYASLMLDLLLPEHVILFRVASLDAVRGSGRKDLGSHFELSQQEVQAYEQTGWDVARAHRSTDIVPEGHGLAAALFAVTRNEMLELDAPTETVTSGLIVTPRRVARIQVLTHPGS